MFLKNRLKAYYKDKNQMDLAFAYTDISKLLVEKYLKIEALEYLEKALEIFTSDKNKFLM